MSKDKLVSKNLTKKTIPKHYTDFKKIGSHIFFFFCLADFDLYIEQLNKGEVKNGKRISNY